LNPKIETNKTMNTTYSTRVHQSAMIYPIIFIQMTDWQRCFTHTHIHKSDTTMCVLSLRLRLTTRARAFHDHQQHIRSFWTTHQYTSHYRKKKENELDERNFSNSQNNEIVCKISLTNIQFFPFRLSCDLKRHICVPKNYTKYERKILYNYYFFPFDKRFFHSCPIRLAFFVTNL
jgi:hypothetical protein